MKSKRLWIILAIIGGVFLLGLVLFPPRNQQQVGSTFGKTPDGYGAWYAYMQKQGYAIEQLQKNEDKFLAQKTPKPTTLLRVYPDFSYGYISEELQQWVETGNRIVLVGVRTPATEAPFQSNFNTAQGEVTIETKRRIPKGEPNLSSLYRLYPQFHSLLGDERGTIVWETTLKKGKIVFVVTPFIAANAYQNTQGNFAFLAHLVNAPKNRIVVDEYLHGYIDREELTQTTDLRNWFSYLTTTPLAIIGLQLGLILLLLLWGHNRRFGNIIPLRSAQVNSNLDYIDALSEVLFKAETYDFLVEKIAKAEQIYIQQKLGLGTAPLPLDLIAASWQQQTRGNSKEIDQALQADNLGGGIKPIFHWLRYLATIRTKLS